MARNMNASSYMSDYNMPTPPWKANNNIGSNLPANTNNFPIPPRNNDLALGQKSTNYEWKKAGITNSFSGDITSGLGFPGQGTGFGGAFGNQGFQSQANNNAGIGSGNAGGGNFGNNFGNNNTGGMGGKSDGNFRGGYGGGGGNNTGGFKDNIVYNSQGGGRPGDKLQGGPQNHNTSSHNLSNSSIGSGDNNRDNNRSFDNKTDSFNRGNNVGNFDRSNSFNNSDRSNNFNNDRPGNFNQTGNTSTFDNRNNNASNDFRNNQNRRPGSSPKSFGDKSANKNNSDQDVRRSTRNQATTNQPTTPKYPLKNPLKAEDLELEKKALAADVSQDFFAKIKPLSLMQVAADVALRYARQEYYLTILGHKTCPEKPSGSGQYTCKTCYMNFLTKEKLNTHNNGPQHKELEDLFRIKKEQARLIMEKKIVGPTPSKLPMKPILEAEAENNLKATELELDVYILGIYESVMKPYWPVPKSNYYCRMCNYLEFSIEADLRHHNTTNDHKKREATYEEAFCLYCQRHYTDKVQLDTHVTSMKHIQIKNLMERTKESAMEQWHKANNIPLAVEKSDTPKVSDLKEISKDNKDALKIGSKRSASVDDNKSSSKKPSTGKPDASTPKSKDDGKKSDREKNDSKASDKRSTSSKNDSRSTPKSDAKPAAKLDAKPTAKLDAKPTAKLDAKSSSSSSSKSDSKPPSKSDPKDVSKKSDPKDISKSDSRSDSRSGSRSDARSDSKSDPKGGSKSDAKIPDNKDKMWFAPVTGSICIVCHDFIKNEEEQKVHVVLSKHIDNIKKFKSLIAD